MLSLRFYKLLTKDPHHIVSDFTSVRRFGNLLFERSVVDFLSFTSNYIRLPILLFLVMNLLVWAASISNTPTSHTAGSSKDTGREMGWEHSEDGIGHTKIGHF